MAVYTEELNTNYNFPNIDIFNWLKDGVVIGYRARPQTGYVMYDTTDQTYELQTDPETGDFVLDEMGNPIEIPVIYYYTMAGFPLAYNFNNFTWVAVLRSTVDENYIFGDVTDKPVEEPPLEVSE